MFFIKNVDSHLVISFLGISLRIKNKNVNYKKYERKVGAYGLNTEPRDKKIIASLTSFPQRIEKIHKTIECLLTQTVRPDKVILWLADSQFPKREESLPESLLRLRNFGLTISWCEDLRSYKKLLPTLKEYPEDIIITFDDDIYYPKDVIEKLYNEYLKNPNNIYTHRANRVYFDKNNNIKLYKSAKLYLSYKKYRNPSFYNTIIGCGGVLYPPQCLHPDVFDIDKIKKYVPTQDDIWFYIMAVLNGTKIVAVDGFDINLVTIEDTQQYGLCKINVKKSSGISPQEALEDLIKVYPNIIDKLNSSTN